MKRQGDSRKRFLVGVGRPNGVVLDTPIDITHERSTMQIGRRLDLQVDGVFVKNVIPIQQPERHRNGITFHWARGFDLERDFQK